MKEFNKWLLEKYNMSVFGLTWENFDELYNKFKEDNMKIHLKTSNETRITPTDYTEKPIIEREWRSTKELVKHKDNLFKKIIRKIV